MSALRLYEDFASNNGDEVVAALQKEFSIQSLIGLANENGYEADDFEWSRHVSEYLPQSKLKLRLAVNDNEVMELDLDEIAAVNGGSAITVAALIALAVAFAAALTQALAAAVNVAYAANIAWTVNVAWTS